MYRFFPCDYDQCRFVCFVHLGFRKFLKVLLWQSYPYHLSICPVYGTLTSAAIRLLFTFNLPLDDWVVMIF